MTISSFLKTTNLKSLFKALITTQRTSPSPFYLLRINQKNTTLTFPDLLFLNRTVSNATLQAHPNRFSVWSPYHLQRLQKCGISNISNKTILTNPYKSEELINKALDMAVTHMVINSLEEYQKIQKIKNSYNKLKATPLVYYWACSDEPNDFQDLKQLRNIINNVIFDWNQMPCASKITQMTQNIIGLGCKLEKVICSTTSAHSQEVKCWSQQTQFVGNNLKLKKEIEIRDVSDLSQYILATKSRGRGVLGIDSMAQELIQLQDYSKNCMMVKVENEEWLISRISKFPMNQQAFLYEMEVRPQGNEWSIGASMI